MKTIKWVGIALMLMAACNTSRITTSWKADNVTPRPYEKIMVLGLIRDVDRVMRESMENHLVGDLKNLGYNAVSSFQQFGPKAFMDMTEEQAVDKLKDNGVDAVLTIVLLDKQKERRYYPGNLYYSPYFYYYDRWWGYRTVLYNRIYEPGYYETDTRYFWESNLYDLQSQKLVYSVQTESFDPSNAESLGHEYGTLIVNDLVKNNVLKQGGVPVKAF